MKKLCPFFSSSFKGGKLFSKLSLISLLCSLFFVNRAEAGAFSGGTGTPEDPYQVVTASELNSIRFFSGAGIYFKQMNDIDLTTYLSSGGAGYAEWGTNGWLPIGDETNNFLGNYDGNNYKIIGLSINRIGTSNVGLFGCTGDGATLKNIKVETVLIENGLNAGGLAGTNHAIITNCYVTGSINGFDMMGGLAGTNYSSITNSYSTVTVNGGAFIGGLAGINNGTLTNCYATGVVLANMSNSGGLVGTNYGTIDSCYATGTIYGDMQVGGLVGTNRSTVSKSYASVAVYGSVNAGGFVGENWSAITNCYATGAVNGYMACFGGLAGSNNGTLTNCYATGAVSGNTNLGGLVGINNTNGIVNGGYWDKQTTGQTTSSGSGVLYGKTTAEMKMQETFAGWDFTIMPIWRIDCTVNDGYPSFVWQGIATSAGTENLINNKVGIYPNPTKGILIINANEGQIKVLSIQGKVISETQLGGNNTIDIGNQPAGVYILILTTKTSVHRYKIIKD